MGLLVAWACVGIAALYAVYRFYLYPTLFSPLRHIPRAQADWHFRLYEWLYTEPNPLRVSRWVEKTQHRGLLRYPGIGGTERVIPLDSDSVKKVLVTQAYSCFERPPLGRARLRALMGNGLLAADGENHKLHRRKLLPAFAFRHIRDLYPVFWTKTCELIDALEEQVVSSQDVDLHKWVSRAALDVIGVAAWGKDFDALANPTSGLVQKYGYVQKGTPRGNRQAKFIYAAANFLPMSMLIRLFPCEFFTNLAQGKTAIRKACSQAINSKRSASQEDKAPRPDILNVALASQEFNDETLVDHMLTVLIAGHETSALAATWACYLLCKHPEVQSRLRAEIRSHLPSPSSSKKGAETNITADLLESIPLLRAVARESLRVIPIVPLLRRQATKQTTILGYSIPAGTSVFPQAWTLHRSTSEWGEDAAEFRPERWLQSGQEATGGGKSTFSNLGFSTGPRSCIGEGFAKGEGLALLAGIIGKFELSFAPGSEIELDKMNLFWGLTVRPTSLRFRMQVVEGW
jgi:cytochrome P450